MKFPFSKRTFAVVSSIVLLLISGVWYYSVSTTTDIYLQNANYELMVDMYNTYQTNSAEVVMLGDSHTYNVNWNELLGKTNVIGRGIRQDIVPGFINRLPQVYKLSPKQCFIMGGINDIYANYSATAILSNYKILIQELKEHNITPIVQSTLFVAESYSNSVETNTTVSELNEGLKKYCTENAIEFVDINSALSKNGYLDSTYTVDGIHCNAAAYKIWRDKIIPILK